MCLTVFISTSQQTLEPVLVPMGNAAASPHSTGFVQLPLCETPVTPLQQNTTVRLIQSNIKYPKKRGKSSLYQRQEDTSPLTHLAPRYLICLSICGVSEQEEEERNRLQAKITAATIRTHAAAARRPQRSGENKDVTDTTPWKR